MHLSMKKNILLSLLSVLICFSGQSQDSDFDKKFRLGLRVTPQPTWFTSNQKNNVPNGLRLGFGFGLNVEYKFSEVAALLTGIGGDFESARYNFRNDYANQYVVACFKDSDGELIELKNGPASNFMKNGVTASVLKNRVISTTHVTLPVILKLSTKENNGLKWFGLLGLEIGVRVKTTATDNYYFDRKFTSDTTFTDDLNPKTANNLVIGKDASLIPLRLGINAGFGAEYNLSGSTSFFGSINFFGGLFNTARKESNYLFSNWVDFTTTSPSTNFTFKKVEQNFLLKAVRVNLGFMF